MAADISGLMKSYGPQIRSLREQLEGLLPKRPAAQDGSATHDARAPSAASSLLEQVSGYLPLILQIGQFVGSRRRPAQAEEPRQAQQARPKPRRRSHWKRYAVGGLIGGAIIGACYLALRANSRSEGNAAERTRRILSTRRTA